MAFIDPDSVKSDFVDPDEVNKDNTAKKVITAPIGATETGANLVTSLPKFVTDTVGSLYALAKGHTGEEKQKDLEHFQQAGNEVLNNMFGTKAANPVGDIVYTPKTDSGKYLTEKVGQGFEKANQAIASVGAGTRAAWEAALAGEGQAGAQKRFETYLPEVQKVTDPLVAAAMLGHSAVTPFEGKKAAPVQEKAKEIAKEASKEAFVNPDTLPDISQAKTEAGIVDHPDVPTLPEEAQPLPELFQEPVTEAPRLPSAEVMPDRKPLLELQDKNEPLPQEQAQGEPYQSRLPEPLQMAPEGPLMEERALTPSEIPAPYPEPFRDLQMEPVKRPIGFIPRSQRGMVDPSVIPDFANKVAELVKFGYDKLTASKLVQEDFSNKADLNPNSSGESSASLEAINRLDQEKSLGQDRVRVRANGEVVPLIGADRVDAQAYPGEVIAQRGIGKNDWTILDSNKANNFAALARLKKQGGGFTPFSSSKVPADAVEKNIAGTPLAEYLDNMGRNATPFYKDAHEVVSQAPDIKPNWWRDNFRSFGANMKRTLNNPAATWVINNVNDFKHIAEYKSRIHEKELQTQLKSFRTMFGSNDEMHKAINEYVNGGVPSTERGRQLHEKLNEINDSIYKELNDAYRAELERKGVPVKDLPYQKNYIPHTWEGPYEFRVKDPDTGRTLFSVREKTKLEAKKALDYIQQKMEDGGISKNYQVDPITFNKGTVASSFVRDAGTIARDFAQVMEDLGLADEDTIAKLQTLEKAIGNQSWSSVGGFKRHTLNRIGVGGWKGNKPWKSATENAKDATEVLLKYVNQAHNFIEAQKASNEFRQFTEANPDKVNLQQLGQTYLDKSFSGTKNLLKPLEEPIYNGIAQTFGVAPRNIQDFLFNVKKATQALTMGFGNATTAAIQLLQGGINVPGEAVRIYAKGKQIPTGAGLLRGVIHTAMYLPNKAITGLGKKAIYLTEEDRKVAEYLQKNGITDTYVVDPGLTHSPSLAKEAAEHIMTGSIRTSDQLGRVWFFSSIVGVLRETGMPLDKAMDKARDLTDITMAPSGTHNQIQAFKKLGSVGEFAGNLKTFALNDLSNWVYDVKQAPKSKADAAALITKLGVILAAAGVMGMPGFQDGDKIWRSLKEWYGTQFSEPSVLNAPSLTEMTLEHLPASAGFGPLSTSTGVNLSDSSGFPSIMPQGIGGALWPLGTAAIDKATGLAQVAKGIATNDKLKTNEGFGRIMPKNVPIISAKIEKNLSEQLPNGDQAQENPNVQYSLRTRLTPEQQTKRMLGFRDLNQAAEQKMQYEISNKNRALSAALKDIENSIPEELAKIQINGNGNLNDLADKYIQLGGDPKTFISRITEAGIRRANLDEVTQHLSRSLQSLRSKETARDAIQSYDKFHQNYK